MAIAAFLLAYPRAGETQPLETALYRIFLHDGDTIVSFGEYARVGDRVVFSMPLGAVSETPRLQLVSIPASTVDWVRTESYTESTRRARYVATRAAYDFATMEDRVARVLDAIGKTEDRVKRLELARSARQTLADWPNQHHGYKTDEIRQMTAILDEIIAELRVANGDSTFDLDLVASAVPPEGEPLLPAPTLQQSIQQVLAVSRLVPASERVSLLQSADSLMAANKGALPAAWTTATRATIRSAIASETRVEVSYARWSRRVSDTAAKFARNADVRGIEQLLRRVPVEAAKLDGNREDLVQALIASLESRLATARQLRLARDGWTLKRRALETYRNASKGSIEALGKSARLLEDIRALAGPNERGLQTLDRRVASATTALQQLTPPAELSDAHSALASALRFAATAVRLRRQAIASADVARAWDASSAASAAIMLLARSRQQLDHALKWPQLATP